MDAWVWETTLIEDKPDVKSNLLKKQTIFK